MVEATIFSTGIVITGMFFFFGCLFIHRGLRAFANAVMFSINTHRHQPKGRVPQPPPQARRPALGPAQGPDVKSFMGRPKPC